MNRVLSRVGQVLGVLFLVGGGAVSLGLLSAIALGHLPGAVVGILSVLLVFFGLAPVSLGGALLYFGTKAKQQALRDRFFYLLQIYQGRLSLLDFARATRMEPAIARRYLDGWAREFSAEFEVTDVGEIYYIFALEPMMLPESVHWQTLKQTVREFVRSL